MTPDKPWQVCPCCDARWHGFGFCWACGHPGVIDREPKPQTYAVIAADDDTPDTSPRH